MGTVLRFPAERVRGALYPAQRAVPAAVVILPVVQIERNIETEDEPVNDGFDAARPGSGVNGRRRRARRS